LYGVALPQGFDNNKVWFFYIVLLYLLWFSICGIIFISIWFLTIGIRALSLAKEGKKFLLFLQKFSREKKRVAHFRFIYEALRAEFGKTNWVFEFLSEKYPISKKKSVETESGK
jgi:hypothetical protein